MKINRRFYFVFVVCFIAVIFSNCETDPFGNKGLALYSNAELFEISREQYDEEIANYRKAGKIVETGPQYEMIQRVGKDIKKAAEDWLEKQGTSDKLEGYFWEFTLVNDDTVNAWAMPGALIVFYTGILPICENDAAVATIMGHEVAHALLNHAQQRISVAATSAIAAGIIGDIFGSDVIGLVAALGLNLGELKFSRDNEFEADEYGQKLMAIAGYDPDQAAPFWERMADLSSGINLTFLSTHPDAKDRTDKMMQNASEAKNLAGDFGVTNFKSLTPTN